jgi:hypothetical protein
MSWLLVSSEQEQVMNTETNFYLGKNHSDYGGDQKDQQLKGSKSKVELQSNTNHLLLHTQAKAAAQCPTYLSQYFKVDSIYFVTERTKSQMLCTK